MASTDEVSAQADSNMANTISDVEKLDAESPPLQESSPTDETQYPSGMAVVLVMASVWLALFLVALVRPESLYFVGFHSSYFP